MARKAATKTVETEAVKKTTTAASEEKKAANTTAEKKAAVTKTVKEAGRQKNSRQEGSGSCYGCVCSVLGQRGRRQGRRRRCQEGLDG